jgi:hypothetical protein
VLVVRSSVVHSHSAAWLHVCGFLCCLQTLVINCAMSHPSQVAFWEPIKTAAAAATPRGQQQQQQGVETPKGDGSNSSNPSAAAKGSNNSNNSSSSPFSSSAGTQQQQLQHEVSWLPWVLQVRSDPAASHVDVVTANTLDELAENTRHCEYQRLFHVLTNMSATHALCDACSAAKRMCVMLPRQVDVITANTLEELAATHATVSNVGDALS